MNKDADKVKKVMKDLCDVLNNSDLADGFLVGILETLKIDLIINAGLIEIDGNPLMPTKKGEQE